ncbi:hypothetical protein DFJ74DRAFT_189827 [Hyaloraphidium curvatum]|nr:hypothetical protein DFJ74DRAFT_189827 [Hyaloraphidium curvatum]
MFLNDERKEAVRLLEAEVQRHNELVEWTNQHVVCLHELRTNDCHKAIEEVERFFNELANAPVEFSRAVADLGKSYAQFDRALGEIRAASADAPNQGAAMAAGGVLAGAGVAALGPSVAMAVATTFGVASTGTAIASLSGAAATNAALAWLGGGALAAGGGGMAAGSAFLAMAGPIGLGIGAALMVGGGLVVRGKNEEVIREAEEKRIQVEQGRLALQRAASQLDEMVKRTYMHTRGVMAKLAALQSVPEEKAGGCCGCLGRRRARNYRSFSKDQKDLLMSLKNDVEALSRLIRERIDLQ